MKNHEVEKIPDIVNKLIGILNKNSINLVHFKSNIHLIDGLTGKTDLDILVKYNDRDFFVKTICKNSFVKVISPSWSKYPFIEDYVGCDQETGVIIHLHVHYKILTGFKRVKHFHIPWENKILSSRITDKETNWPIPSYVDEFLVFIIRIQLKSKLRSFFLRKSFYPENVKSEFTYLSSQVTKKNIIDRLGQLELSLIDSDIDILLANSNYDEIKAIGNKIISQINNGPRYSFGSTLLISFFQGVLYWHARNHHRKGKLSKFKKTINNRGLTIAFIGVDGSGKSTVTQSIYDWLIPKVDSHIVYLGSGDGKKGNIEKIRSRLRKKSPISKLNNTYLRIFVRSFFDTFLIIRKTLLIKKSKKMSKNGSVIIMDRFPQNQFFGINDGPKVPKLKSLFLFRAIENYCFKVCSKNSPDMVVKLEIDYVTSMHRKPDHNPDVIKEKIKQIKKIHFENTKVVDSKADLHNVLLKIKRLLWIKILDNQKDD